MSYPLPLRTVALVGRQESPEVADSIAALAAFFTSHGIAVLVETETAIQAAQVIEKSALVGAECADFAQIGQSADLVVVGVGARPNAELLAGQADMALGPVGGIKVRGWRLVVIVGADPSARIHRPW